jgi:hypothetical protein
MVEIVVVVFVVKETPLRISIDDDIDDEEGVLLLNEVFMIWYISVSSICCCDGRF